MANARTLRLSPRPKTMAAAIAKSTRRPADAPAALQRTERMASVAKPAQARKSDAAPKSLGPEQAAKTRGRRPSTKPHAKASVSIIIPVFNQAALTAQCVKSLLGGDKAEIIVVDDASTDSTPQLLRELGAKVRSVRHETNRGFAQSCNDGAAAASGDFLVFLNNDTVPKPGWLDALVRYAQEHPEAAAVGAKLLYPNDTVQHAGVVICQDRYPRHIYAGFPADHPAVCKSRRFQIVTGACLLIRRELFLKLNGFDSAFRNGFEDVDFCLRVGELGLEVHYCAESVLYHFESSSPGRFKNDSHNVALYRERWLKRVQPDDVSYFLQDGLIDLSYEGTFPLQVRLSPLLGVLHMELRNSEAEKLLADKSRQAADLIRENTRLRRELGKTAFGSSALEYEQLRQQVREVIHSNVPEGATVLVISKGDGALLELDARKAWHFPQAQTGAYAGYHPADSAAAIDHLEELRAKGAQYLVLPKTAYWWLEHYQEFRSYLESQYTQIPGGGTACLVYALRGSSNVQPETRSLISVQV